MELEYLRFTKNTRARVILSLVWNYLLWLKLQVVKFFTGRKTPIVHYYAICWNEEKMLPFMLQYYEKYVDRFVIYDNYSTDHTNEILRHRSDTKVIKYDTGGQICDDVYLKIKNNCWKKSRGRADFVIVGDIDEFLFIEKGLDRTIIKMFNKQESILKPQGYNMYTEKFPQYSELKVLPELITKGERLHTFDKCILFDPHKIIEIAYYPGAHECLPNGYVKFSEESAKLLHYKNTSLCYMISRKLMYKERLSQNNIANNWGWEYLQEKTEMEKEFYEGLARSSQIVSCN